jgi:hypothetical protein
LGAVAKHRAGDIEEPIADGAEGTCVAVAAQAQSGVLGAAARIVLHGNACPVVESVLEPRITGEPSRDDAALSATLGGRSSVISVQISAFGIPNRSIFPNCRTRPFPNSRSFLHRKYRSRRKSNVST